MYKENWIQRWRQAPVYSYESCSVAHEAKMARLPSDKVPGSSGFRIHWAHRAGAVAFPLTPPPSPRSSRGLGLIHMNGGREITLDSAISVFTTFRSY